MKPLKDLTPALMLQNKTSVVMTFSLSFLSVFELGTSAGSPDPVNEDG